MKGPFAPIRSRALKQRPQPPPALKPLLQQPRPTLVANPQESRR